MQSWSGGKPTINTGETGLGRLDYIVKKAEELGVKLIVPLVNNWGDYGGMKVYVQQMAGTDAGHEGRSAERSVEGERKDKADHGDRILHKRQY